MADVKVFYDRVGNTLTVWFADPSDEYVVEEASDDILLMKDRAGRVIGFEKLHVAAHDSEHVRVAFETMVS